MRAHRLSRKGMSNSPLRGKRDTHFQFYHPKMMKMSLAAIFLACAIRKFNSPTPFKSDRIIHFIIIFSNTLNEENAEEQGRVGAEGRQEERPL